MITRKRMLPLACALIMCLIVSGCGSSPLIDGEAGLSNAYVSEGDYEAETAEMSEDLGVADYDTSYLTEGSRSMAKQAMPNSADDESMEAEEPQAKSEEKLVYTCSMQIETLTYAETLANIRSKIKEVGGIIESENEDNSDHSWYLSEQPKRNGTMHMYLTVRIPTAKYEEFLSSLEGEGKVMSKSSSVENISRQYRDTQAIIRNLEMQEERLQHMMKEAKMIEEMIQVETRLTEVQTQLDQMRTSLASMDTDVALSTVNLTLNEVVKYEEEPPKTETFKDRLKNAFHGSARVFKNAVETMIIAAIYLLPTGILLIAVCVIFIYIIFAILRGIFRASQKKKKKSGESKVPDSETAENSVASENIESQVEGQVEEESE